MVFDPITFNRDGDWTTATCKIADDTITGAPRPGDQAALRALVHVMASSLRRERDATAGAVRRRDIALEGISRAENDAERSRKQSTELRREVERLKADGLAASMATNVLNNQLALTRIEADGHAQRVQELRGQLKTAQDREVELAVELAAMDRRDEELDSISPRNRAMQAALAADQAAEEASWKESRHYTRLAAMWIDLAMTTGADE